jgi:hypothetical protein
MSYAAECPTILIYFTLDVLKYPEYLTNTKFLHCVALDDGTITLSRNVGNRTPTYAAQHPRRVKTASLIHLTLDSELCPSIVARFMLLVVKQPVTRTHCVTSRYCLYSKVTNRSNQGSSTDTNVRCVNTSKSNC